jgi:dihydroflavonol-4-reductase
MESAQPIDLVTGATGLVGSNLVRLLLAQKRRVRLLVRKTSNRARFEGLNGLEFVEGDVNDPASLPAAFSGVEHAYHLAANVTVTPRMTDAIWRTNVTGTEAILQAARESGIRRLIYCSTVDALGLPEGPEPATEETPWNWDRLGVENAYARSKYEAHQRVLAAAKAGLNAVIVCPAFMFGAYDARPSSGQLILAVARRQLPGYPGGGNNFVDVEDVTQGMLSAAQLGRAGEVYILGGKNLTYQEIFTVIARVVGAPAPRFAIPYPIAWVGGQLGGLYERLSGRDTGLNPATARVSYLRHYYSPAKAIRELGLPQTPIETAIGRAAAWFREKGMLRD